MPSEAGKQGSVATVETPPPSPSQTQPPRASQNTTQSRGNYVKIFEQIDAKICHLKEEVFGIPEFLDLQDLIRGLKEQIFKDALETQDALVRVTKQLTIKATTTTVQPTASYASAVRGEGLEARKIPLRAEREIRVQCPNVTEATKTKAPEQLVKEINSKLVQGTGSFLGARWLPSGELILTTDSTTTKKQVEANQDWVKAIGQQAVIQPKKYTVMIHGVRVAAIDMDKQAESIKKIMDQNPALQGRIHILRAHWRRKTIRLKKTSGALLIDLPSTEEADLLIDEGLFFENELKLIERFDPKCLITRCYNCQAYGHTAHNCRAKTKCSWCAAVGHTHLQCPVADQPTKRRCANCEKKHEAGNEECPEQKREKDRAYQAYLNKPSRFATKQIYSQPLATSNTMRMHSTFTATGKRTRTVSPGPTSSSEDSQTGWQLVSKRGPGRPRKQIAMPNDGRIKDFLGSPADPATSADESPRDDTPMEC